MFTGWMNIVVNRICDKDESLPEGCDIEKIFKGFVELYLWPALKRFGAMHHYNIDESGESTVCERCNTCIYEFYRFNTCDICRSCYSKNLFKSF